MNLGSRLARLSPVGLAPVAPPPPGPTRVEGPAPAGFLAPVPSVHGPLRQVDRLHGPDYRHGRVAPLAAREVSGAAMARLALDERLAGVDLSRLLLMDTETTGLHGGAGTLPFLVGLGWFEGEALVVRQLFLGRPGEEAPMLREFAARLAAASALVTFNGKCFDWPLLRTRLVMNRVAAPALPPHVDLLHCARRLFKRRLGSTRLQDLEAHVLGFHRAGDDIEGALIPEVYFEWLRSGATARLQRVLEHNVRDVVTMAAVLAELGRRVERVADDDAAEDCLSLAEVTLRAGDAARAEALAVVAAGRAGRGATALEAWALAAKLAGRRRDWAAAAERLEAALAVPGAPRRELAAVHLALSRVLERRLQRRGEALHHARLGAGAEAPEAAARRAARLAPAGRVSGQILQIDHQR